MVFSVDWRLGWMWVVDCVWVVMLVLELIVVADEIVVMLVELFGFVDEMLGTSMVLVWFVSVDCVVLMLLGVDGSVVLLVGC